MRMVVISQIRIHFNLLYTQTSTRTHCRTILKGSCSAGDDNIWNLTSVLPFYRRCCEFLYVPFWFHFTIFLRLLQWIRQKKSREHMLKIADKQIQLEQLGLLVEKKGENHLSLLSTESKMPIKTRVKNDDEIVKHLRHGLSLPWNDYCSLLFVQHWRAQIFFGWTFRLQTNVKVQSLCGQFMQNTVSDCILFSNWIELNELCWNCNKMIDLFEFNQSQIRLSNKTFFKLLENQLYSNKSTSSIQLAARRIAVSRSFHLDGTSTTPHNFNLSKCLQVI